MSNTEMVSVPREWAQHYADLLEERCGYEKAEQVTAFLAQLAQHQGEPVVSQCALCCQTHEQVPVGRVGGQQANGCDVDFTTWRCEGCGGSWTGDPSDPAEVERLRADLARIGDNYADALETSRGLWRDRDRMEKQLAEAHALLIESHDLLNSGHLAAASTYARQRAYSLIDKIKTVLSASAEQSDECAHSYANKVGCPECGEEFGAEPNPPKCKYCGDTGQIMVGRSGDASDGNAPVLEPCEDCERGAPVERDERAEFENDIHFRGMDFTRAPGHPDYYGSPYANGAWHGWRFGRAALERKPSALVAQLQSDLTARDEELDGIRIDAGRYRWLRSRDLDEISKGGVFAGMTPDNLVLNEDTLDREIDATMAKELQP
ncbi:hypothetical protein N5D52_19155 [Pseudomonas sp. GD03860]|uniref:hypothetical protein n=1 Tax=Pseudomonas sp. GD03860 TaxID=2975389 RepID=UPI00244C4190|nr:hypothetical protein [Pseudomonas sp. GD03860]MDH0639058.1 hypothetical protein [Pseudomonas sp. GD03860]